MVPVALNPAGMSPQMWGITPDVALSVQGVNDHAHFRNFADRRHAIRRQLAKDFNYDAREIRKALFRTMASKPDDAVRSAAQYHWVSRVLDTSSTNGGNILPR